MKVKDGIRAWSIILYDGKPHIILRFNSIDNLDRNIVTVEIAEWKYSIDAFTIRNISFKELYPEKVLYDNIKDSKVLLSW